MNDVQVAFRVSRWRRCGVGVLVGALLVCIGVYFFGVMRWLLWGAVVLAGVWGWREPDRVRHLMIDEEYQAWLLWGDGNEWVLAQLCSGSLIHRWGCFLKWRCGRRVFWQVVLPDMCDADAFRRLRVWAQFGQKR